MISAAGSGHESTLKISSADPPGKFPQGFNFAGLVPLSKKQHTELVLHCGLRQFLDAQGLSSGQEALFPGLINGSLLLEPMQVLTGRMKLQFIVGVHSLAKNDG